MRWFALLVLGACRSAAPTPVATTPGPVPPPLHFVEHCTMHSPMLDQPQSKDRDVIVRTPGSNLKPFGSEEYISGPNVSLAVRELADPLSLPFVMSAPVERVYRIENAHRIREHEGLVEYEVHVEGTLVGNTKSMKNVTLHAVYMGTIRTRPDGVIANALLRAEHTTSNSAFMFQIDCQRTFP